MSLLALMYGTYTTITTTRWASTYACIVAHVSCVFYNNVGIFDADARCHCACFSPIAVECGSAQTLHIKHIRIRTDLKPSSEVAMYLYVTIVGT